MPFRAVTLLDLRQRSESFAREIEAYERAAHEGVLSREQRAAFLEMFREANATHEKTLAEMTSHLPLRAFGKLKTIVEESLFSAYDRYTAVRDLVRLRSNPLYAGPLGLADATIVEAYELALARGRALGAKITSRAAPIVHAEPELSPVVHGLEAAARRAMRRRFRDDPRLTVPIVIVPSDLATSIGLLSTLQHEIGHVILADLGLVQELRETLRKVAPERGDAWAFWTVEIAADALGVLLGGSGFVFALASFLLAPSVSDRELGLADDHPPARVRMRLQAELLQRVGGAILRGAAHEVRHFWSLDAPPPSIAPYLADCDEIAEAVLDAPLDALGGHGLRSLVPSAPEDAEEMQELARALAEGGRARPIRAARFVPAAARVAALLPSASASHRELDARALAWFHERGVER